MRHRLRIIFWSIILLGSGVVLSHLLQQPDIAVAEETYRFDVAQRSAVTAGNRVVYSRHIVTNTGLPNWKAKLQPWKTLASGEPTRAPVQVVFVHGYNATFAESIAQGNYLAPLLRQWTAQKYPGTTVDFHTFSWRADFGPDRFHTAELSARVQSASLANFLQSLPRTTLDGTPCQLFIITHSLGARVALEAIAKHGTGADFPPVRALLCIQPAVARTALARGTYDTVNEDRVTNTRYDGEYFQALSRIGAVLATCSATDGVLAQHYASLAEVKDTSAAPKLNIALGQPYYSSTEAEVFPANFRLIDFSPGRYLSAALPSHDSLFDVSGRRALWTLWDRLLSPAMANP